MIKKIRLIFSLSLVCLFGGSALSVMAAVPSNVMQINKDAIKAQVQENVQNTVQQYKNIREVQLEMRQVRQTTRTENRMERKELIIQKVQTVKEVVQQKRQEVREQVQIIKEGWKQQVVENLYDLLNGLNERLAKRFNDVIDQIEAVLGRIENRTDTAEANDYDVTAVRSAITEAKNAIASARTAIDAQIENVYTFEITDEITVGGNISEARHELHNDLAAVRKIVLNAKEAVKKAAIALAQIPRVNELTLPTGEETN